ncbi:5-carboxymethyl-2-hydroxymuconate Delta-isomerase [Vibrio hannami]|uniref:5-carboxymethyl-2-hydroxymuconate Delta-isomerase n=1 Tax=Vibrio hannami TaxID=2717094 RepID=UPI00240F1BAF|nr:5-carboxymethyl-2-hydroxymuconate Delta-isomerase [Vibrio hannami]MDG3084642.1 5-carboxymethyl-2-hydroxymuconate Delta-isomerase [Vibrio hannami]
MPNLVMEYTSSVEERVNIQGLLEDLHQVALDCGLFAADDVKTRGLRCHHWLIGEKGDSEDFIHISFELLSGRTIEQKKKLADDLMDVLKSQASAVSSLSLNMRDMERETFVKVLNN